MMSMTNDPNEALIDQCRNLTEMNKAVETVETMRQELMKLARVCDKQYEIIEKLYAALEIAAKDYAATAFEREEGCNDDNCRHYYGCGENTCAEHVLSAWMKEVELR